MRSQATKWKKKKHLQTFIWQGTHIQINNSNLYKEKKKIKVSKIPKKTSQWTDVLMANEHIIR